ncbi:MAG: hypothetical protein V1744_04080 [Candidatus Altiarchaeota archaeon]
MDAFQIVWGTSLILAAILLPGLAVTFAIFPKKGQVNPPERIGLGLIFGILPQLMLYFLMKNLSIQSTTSTTTLSVLLVTAVGLAVWYKRRLTTTA